MTVDGRAQEGEKRMRQLQVWASATATWRYGGRARQPAACRAGSKKPDRLRGRNTSAGGAAHLTARTQPCTPRKCLADSVVLRVHFSSGAKGIVSQTSGYLPEEASTFVRFGLAQDLHDTEPGCDSDLEEARCAG